MSTEVIRERWEQALWAFMEFGLLEIIKTRSCAFSREIYKLWKSVYLIQSIMEHYGIWSLDWYVLMCSSAISSEVFLLMIQRLSLLDCRQSDWQKSVILGLTTIDGLQKPPVILHQPQTKTSKLKRRKRRRIMRRKTSTDWGKTGQSQVHRQHFTDCNICQPPPPTSNREVTFPCICRCKVGTKRVQNWNW